MLQMAALATTSESSMKKKLVKSKEVTQNSRETDNNEFNKGAWTAEEDQKLAEVITVNGPKRWKAIAAKAGLNRCGKSCRLRWLNYLRPNIKRGNISDQEEDLILRLHKLLGNRWSLIAGRLPGRTDNEIKNYWNSHLSKKMNRKQKPRSTSPKEGSDHGQQNQSKPVETVHGNKESETSTTTTTSEEAHSSGFDSFNADDFFDFSNENPLNLEWVSRFLELDRQRSNK